MSYDIARKRAMLPVDVTDTVNRMVQMARGREVDARQNRDYVIHCANGDEIYVRERTRIRIYEVKDI